MLKLYFQAGANEPERVFEAQSGERLYDVLARNGVRLSAPCGGRGMCGKCRVRAEGGVDIEEDGTCLACKSEMYGDCHVFLEEKASSILTGGKRGVYETDGEEGLAMAVDIGTTTLAAYLLDRKSGRELSRASMLNPQRIHGADVITRLNYACAGKEQKELLHREMLEALDALKTELLQKAGLDEDTCEPSRICLVGNTIMMHFAGDYDASGMAKAPYLPYYVAAHDRMLNGQNALLGGCISGYVGADTVAAMLSCELDKSDKTVLLIDIGTNGEIVLKHKDRFMCCSCAAGPAFEGAHIACGTGAIEGAIDHFKMDDTGKASYTTIGQKPALGICGSGLIDIIACLVEQEIISPVGRMKERFEIAPQVYLDPRDINEVQLAKAAVAAGISILVRKMGIGLTQIDEVLLAGGFGNYMSVPSACIIGLIPSELQKRVINVGNAAGDGAKMQALSRSCLARAEQMRQKTIYVDLAAEEDFEDIFADNLIFDI